METSGATLWAYKNDHQARVTNWLAGIKTGESGRNSARHLVCCSVRSNDWKDNSYTRKGLVSGVAKESVFRPPHLAGRLPCFCKNVVSALHTDLSALCSGGTVGIVCWEKALLVDRLGPAMPLGCCLIDRVGSFARRASIFLRTGTRHLKRCCWSDFRRYSGGQNHRAVRCGQTAWNKPDLGI